MEAEIIEVVKPVKRTRRLKDGTVKSYTTVAVRKIRKENEGKQRNSYTKYEDLTDVQKEEIRKKVDNDVKIGRICKDYNIQHATFHKVMGDC